MKLPNKIKNLNILKKCVSIPRYIYFNKEEYKKNKLKILKKINLNFKNFIILRSAAFDEDNNITNAGKYLSVKNISSNDKDKILRSINKIFESYKSNKNNFIIIQNYINNAKSVGVIFTRNANNNYPFRTINFNESIETDIITSGKNNGKIISYFEHLPTNLLNKNVRKINKEILKIEKKLKYKALDIEFLTDKNKVWILQVRKLNVLHKKKLNFEKILSDLSKKLKKMMLEKSYLLGDKRYFSTMTDWNPAEIIGLKPKPLALSLYKSLITDEIWAESRTELGYKNIGKIPLLYNFLGTPYIDVKTDINSFLISNLPKNIQEKLIKHYLSKFRKKPIYYYDKIESKLIINSISLNVSKYKKLLPNKLFNKKEKNLIILKYIELTSQIINKLNYNIKKYEEGNNLFVKLKNSRNSSINKIYLLTNFCKNFGTLPFANLARMAFIAVEFLNSLVDLKIINKKELGLFLESNRSVSKEMHNTLLENKKTFIIKFGHLRPNTYEISNLNYKENFHAYFKSRSKKKFFFSKFNLSKNQHSKINILLKKNNFKNIDSKSIINFIKNAIYHRESSKLFFTRIIDEIFNQLKLLSKRINLNNKDLEYLDFQKILNLYNNFSSEYLIKDIKKTIIQNKKDYEINKIFNLPNVIIKSEDIYVFKEDNASPTYITDRTISSEIYILNKNSMNYSLDGKIICILNADPGYDFIFNYKINGVITAFGGPNSHMSIRCHELKIPAVIGVGENKFKKLIESNTLYLNCKKKIIKNV